MPFQLPPEICPVCQKKSKFSYLQDYQNENGQFSLYECFYCQVQFWQPFQNPGKNWYEDYKDNKLRISDFSEETTDIHVKNSWNTKQFFKNPLFRESRNKKILDLGCGTGEFLSEVKKLGYDVYGVDFDENEIALIKENFDIENVFAEDIFKFLKKKQEIFDVISGFEILEHLDKPKEFLNLIYQALKPGGYLILSVPNRERFFGKITEWWDFPPGHLTRWNSKSLKNILQQTRFKIMEIKENRLFEYFTDKLNKLCKEFFRIFNKILPGGRESKVCYRRREKNIISRIWFQKNTIIDIFLNIPRLNKFRGIGLVIFAQKIQK
jgi:2-polyprenyl-3-methyl-5-hydroxy-6-metoxy-1,4-benzoquinol methylase